jgi:membrane-bound serine protease (ClpP class)
MRYRALFLTLALFLLASTAHAEGKVIKVGIKGAIGVATADHVISAIEHAEETGAELVIIDMDTPGGLMAPMRDIVT